ncbi:MAG TPA: hypothetical protein VNO13_10715, partial [Candidatus Udaeobacter sp.]|nr:hypothetical protein [Candidatus Udaeobacter sp.]
TVTINGTAVTAVTIVAAAGATLSTSVSAGQTAQFNLQAMPGAGFSGTLAFACSGAPTGATCSAPNVTVTNGAAVNFMVTVTTSGSAVVVPATRRTIRPRPAGYTAAALLLLMLLALWFYARQREWRETPAGAIDWKRAVALACLALLASGCGNNTKRDVHVDDCAVRNASGFHEKFPDFTDFINLSCEVGASTCSSPLQG